MTKIIVTVFLFLLVFSGGALGNDQCGANDCPLTLELKEGKDAIIKAGHFNLIWPVKENSSEENTVDETVVADALIDDETHPATKILIASDQNFSQITHSIPIHATKRMVSLTGFTDGVYFARLVDEDNQPVSNFVKITVEHHSMQRVMIIFASGAILFGLLIAYMVAKVFRHKEEG
ncbi:hypothetical protein [Kangiella sediminilitoris]|uniref:Uncharacterized protein n=1 Tax=Kangiella sediminilitoris TaxID=1144748 RepID=A0A1B3B8W1_9GAMM|nr:hypothetical protein [Kangiella sediminilitoris]AOE49239.1 hypothetical protein KS2013_515 [Kangiella sediminilitoris]